MAFNRSPPNGYKPGSMPMGGGKPSNRMPLGGVPMLPGRDHRGLAPPQFTPRERGIMQAYHRFMPAFPQRERSQFIPTYQRMRNLPMELARVRGPPPPPPLYQMERVTMVPQSPYARDRGAPYPKDHSPTPNFSRDKPYNVYKERGSSPYPRDTYSRSKSPSVRSRSPASARRVNNHEASSAIDEISIRDKAEKSTRAKTCSPSPEKPTMASDNEKDQAPNTNDMSNLSKDSTGSQGNETAADTSQNSETYSEEAIEDNQGNGLETSVPRPLGTGDSETLNMDSTASLPGSALTLNQSASDGSMTTTALPVVKASAAAAAYKHPSGLPPGQAINSVIERLTSYASMKTIRVDPVAAREFLPLKKRIMSAFAMGQDTTSISSKQPVPHIGNHESRRLHVYAEYDNTRGQPLPAIKASSHEKPKSGSHGSKESRKRKSHSRSSSQPSEKKPRPSKPTRSDQTKVMPVVTPTRRTRSQTKTTPDSKDVTKSKLDSDEAKPSSSTVSFEKDKPVEPDKQAKQPDQEDSQTQSEVKTKPAVSVTDEAAKDMKEKKDQSVESTKHAKDRGKMSSSSSKSSRSSDKDRRSYKSKGKKKKVPTATLR